jgi:hypothetical protein
MNERKRKETEQQLEMIDKRLANAREYVARNVNVEGSSWLHFGDWWGKSGHPSWMRNWMIPTTMRGRARKERALDNLENKAKDKNLTRRKRQGATQASASGIVADSRGGR